ncbi:hypothetical protein [Algibacter agarivorans]|uniref:hypothetical protein n=1 Tax=Algibacter agarivorans TaxID=1109741 RepID=UPI0031E75AA5
MTVHLYTEANVGEKLSNPELASMVSMTPNSFARLFKEEMHITFTVLFKTEK